MDGGNGREVEVIDLPPQHGTPSCFAPSQHPASTDGHLELGLTNDKTEPNLGSQ